MTKAVVILNQQQPNIVVGPQGPQGVAGSQGVQGIAGVQGPQGVTGVQGPQVPTLSFGGIQPTSQTLTSATPTETIIFSTSYKGGTIPFTYDGTTFTPPVGGVYTLNLLVSVTVSAGATPIPASSTLGIIVGPRTGVFPPAIVNLPYTVPLEQIPAGSSYTFSAVITGDVPLFQNEPEVNVQATLNSTSTTASVTFSGGQYTGHLVTTYS